MKKKLLLILFITAIFVISACGDGQRAGIQETPNPTLSQNGENPPGNGTEPNIPGNGVENGNGANPGTGGDPQAPSVFSFTFRDINIELDDDIDYVISKLGEPRDDKLVPSCAFEGMQDRIVWYSEFEIHAYPIGENHFIFIIDFFSDAPRTSEGGISIGAPVQDVLNAYGDDYTYEAGMYRFTRGLTCLEFIVIDGYVDRIRYRLDLGL